MRAVTSPPRSCGRSAKRCWRARRPPRSTRELTILDADIPGDLASDKAIILDICAVLDDGIRVDVEMHLAASRKEGRAELLLELLAMRFVPRP